MRRQNGKYNFEDMTSKDIKSMEEAFNRMSPRKERLQRTEYEVITYIRHDTRIRQEMGASLDFTQTLRS